MAITYALPDEFFAWVHTEDGALFRGDVACWIERRNMNLSINEATTKFYFGLTEFRSLVDYRAERSKEGRAFTALFRELRRANDLYIHCPDIGPGLFIQHGHSTWILAERIGSRFTVNQNVTIGATWKGSPIIGADVSIRTGAVIAGPVTIGDRVVVAPNAFVNFDVPNDHYAFAPRTTIVPRKGKKG